MPKKKQKRGPPAQHVAIEGDWRAAIAKAVRIERPAAGWPDPDNRPAPKRQKRRQKP